MKDIYRHKATPSRFFFVIIVLAGVLLTACAFQPASPTAQVLSVVNTTDILNTNANPTETTVWFPATSTPTLMPPPLPTATQVSLSGIGNQIAIDPFTDPQKWTGTVGENTTSNRIILNENGMVFALNETPARLTSLNSELFLSDAFIIIDATINRCSGPDTYGILFKAGSQNLGNRLALNCQGEVRLEQLRENMVLPLADWSSSGDVPLGGPGQVRIGIWTSGSEIRVFLNEHYQFTLFDSFYQAGAIGLFASSTNPAGLNIRFSEIEVRNVDFSSPTPTLQSSRTPFQRASSTPTP